MLDLLSQKPDAESSALKVLKLRLASKATAILHLGRVRGKLKNEDDADPHQWRELVLLAKPTVIMPKPEPEAELFPGLESAPELFTGPKKP